MESIICAPPFDLPHALRTSPARQRLIHMHPHLHPAPRAANRFALPLQLGLAAVAIATLTRIALAFRVDSGGHTDEVLRAVVIGLGYDLIAALFIVAPFAVWLALLPNRPAAWRWLRALYALGTVFLLFALLLTAVSEWVFWDEFGSRFNFIAVDYLIYTQEVLGNIWQSYPVGKVLALLAVITLLAAIPLVRAGWRHGAAPLGWQGRMLALIVSIGLPIVVFYTVSADNKQIFARDDLNELAGNGLYEFAAAARNNEMDYLRLYARIADREAFALVRQQMAGSVDGFRAPGSEWDLARIVQGRGPERRLNVVLVSEESLGAEFLGSWGNSRGLTPRLDALAKESLVFANVFATGNRTVRGLEALSIALPPTPGQSVVKRPHNEHLFTLGSVFEDRDYDTLFLYGGYGYFDNMNAYFAGNDYRAVDRTAIAKDKIHYENIWGVADEDLFDLAIDEIGKSIAAANGKRPVFAHIMTTSNHRPYTYPEGRIDIPSGTGRDGAVKYADWALGHFIDEARKQPWFKDTLFVLTADHGANARGTRDIPIEKYRIPLLIYAPAHIKPQKVERLMSQIDIAPTLLGLLNFNYVTKFFGQDVFRQPPGTERAFVANYQTLGYLRDGRLVTLSPKRQTRVEDNPMAGARGQLDEETLVREAIAWYQTAFLSFRTGLNRDEDH